MSSPKKKQRKSRFLGPIGPDVEVQFDPHSLGRLIERFTPEGPKNPKVLGKDFEMMGRARQQLVFEQALDAGLPYQEFIAALRQPNAGRVDEISSQSYGSTGDVRYCRWFRPFLAGARCSCMVVFIIDAAPADGFAGRIRVVTVYPPT